MSMPTSGAINMAQLNSELGRASTTPLSIVDSSLNLLRGSSSTPVSISAFYGKTRFILSAAATPGGIGYRRDTGNGSLSPVADSRYGWFKIESTSSSMEIILVTGFAVSQNYWTSLTIGGNTYYSANAVSFNGSGVSGYGISPEWIFYVQTPLVVGGGYDVYIN